MAPTRLGVPLRPTFFNVVVVQPSWSIIGKTPEETRIYRLDKLVRKIRGEDPSPLTMLKMISADTLHAFAADLVSYLVPAPTPVVSQPNVPPAPVPTRSKDVPHKCQNCGGPLSGAEANYCRAKPARFAGQLLCRRCQGYAPKAGKKPGERNLAANVKEPELVAHCAVCGTLRGPGSLPDVPGVPVNFGGCTSCNVMSTVPGPRLQTWFIFSERVGDGYDDKYQPRSSNPVVKLPMTW